MRRCLAVLAGVAMIFALMGASMAAEAQSPDVMTIIKQMKQVFEPSRPTVSKVVITNTDNKGRTGEWVAGRAWKDFSEGKRMILVLLEPGSVRGDAIVVWDRARGDQKISYFEYLPFTRRVREFQGLYAYDPCLNMQFTYSDLGLIPVDERYTLLGTEERNGVRAYKIEEKVPGEHRLYSRIIVWAAADSGLPVERDYYDKAQRLWKTETFKEITVYNGVPLPRVIEMKDVLENFKTELKIVMMNQGVDIPDEIFNPEFLKHASEAPVWKFFGPGAGNGK